MYVVYPHLHTCTLHARYTPPSNTPLSLTPHHHLPSTFYTPPSMHDLHSRTMYVLHPHLHPPCTFTLRPLTVHSCFRFTFIRFTPPTATTLLARFTPHTFHAQFKTPYPPSAFHPEAPIPFKQDLPPPPLAFGSSPCK